MGGYGSGRWNYHDKKDVVEECLTLSTVWLAREGCLQLDTLTSGRWFWMTQGNQVCATVDYTINTQNHAEPHVLLSYCVNGMPFSDRFQLSTTQPHYGGTRWWLHCPYPGCQRRVGKLYLPTGGRHFRCRQCHQLTYRSCQESDKRVSLLRRNPWALLEKPVEEITPTELLLLLKVSRFF